MTDHVRLNGIVPLELAGARLDQALARMFPQFSRNRIQQWIRSGSASVNGQTRRPKDAVDGGERVEISAPADVDERWTAEPIALNLVHEDPELLVVDKPAGLVVHPGAGNPDGTLVNALLHYAPALSSIPRAGIVHRLDKDTSGLMVVAKTLTAHKALVDQLAARRVRRYYQALVLGELVSGGRFDGRIGRHPTQRTRMAVTEGGREALSHVRVIQRLAGMTHVEVRLETGRTHQIRVHLAHAGYPLVGDRTYGGFGKPPAGAGPDVAEAAARFSRQALHAARLSLVHPASNAEMCWDSPLADDIRALLELARSAAADPGARH